MGRGKPLPGPRVSAVTGELTQATLYMESPLASGESRSNEDSGTKAGGSCLCDEKAGPRTWRSFGPPDAQKPRPRPGHDSPGLVPRGPARARGGTEHPGP